MAQTVGNQDLGYTHHFSYTCIFYRVLIYQCIYVQYCAFILDYLDQQHPL